MWLLVLLLVLLRAPLVLLRAPWRPLALSLPLSLKSMRQRHSILQSNMGTQ